VRGAHRVGSIRRTDAWRHDEELVATRRTQARSFMRRGDDAIEARLAREQRQRLDLRDE
jgi:hypothetical protein